MAMASRAATALVLALLVLPAASEAWAHGWSRSVSSWTATTDGARVRLRMSALDLSALPPDVAGGRGGVGAYAAERLQMMAGDVPCRASPAGRVAAPADLVVYEWTVHCDTPGARSIRSTLLQDVLPSHLHFARMRGADGGLLERVLSGPDSLWRFEAGDRGAPGPDGGSGRDALARHVRLGVEHIVTGWDHLAFVLALLLLAGTMRELTVLVTAFTTAHSLTLALAVLGMARPDPTPVEALIGFSIALVAAENASILSRPSRNGDAVIAGTVVGGLAIVGLLAMRGVGALPPATVLGLTLFSACHFGLLRRARHPARVRAAIAFAFGLVHGFGFAGVLAEVELPTDRLVPALLGFNVGVEIGQLAIVAALWPWIRWLAARSRGRWYAVVTEGGSAAIGGLGTFWFIARAFG
jgi:hypothetical protein